MKSMWKESHKIEEKKRPWGSRPLSVVCKKIQRGKACKELKKKRETGGKKGQKTHTSSQTVGGGAKRTTEATTGGEAVSREKGDNSVRRKRHN